MIITKKITFFAAVLYNFFLLIAEVQASNHQGLSGCISSGCFEDLFGPQNMCPPQKNSGDHTDAGPYIGFSAGFKSISDCEYLECDEHHRGFKFESLDVMQAALRFNADPIASLLGGLNYLFLELLEDGVFLSSIAECTLHHDEISYIYLESVERTLYSLEVFEDQDSAAFELLCNYYYDQDLKWLFINVLHNCAAPIRLDTGLTIN